jgi:hypothetical protein
MSFVRLCWQAGSEISDREKASGLYILARAIWIVACCGRGHVQRAKAYWECNLLAPAGAGVDKEAD